MWLQAWHCDDSELGPRDISVVAYFTDPSEYEGGELQLQCDASLARLPSASDRAFALAADQSPPEDARALPETTQLLRLRFGAGASVAFPSKTLEHRVTPVTKGERRSLLLLCRRAGSQPIESGAGALVIS